MKIVKHEIDGPCHTVDLQLRIIIRRLISLVQEKLGHEFVDQGPQTLRQPRGLGLVHDLVEKLEDDRAILCR